MTISELHAIMITVNKANPSKGGDAKLKGLIRITRNASQLLRFSGLNIFNVKFRSEHSVLTQSPSRYTWKGRFFMKKLIIALTGIALVFAASRAVKQETVYHNVPMAAAAIADAVQIDALDVVTIPQPEEFVEPVTVIPTPTETAPIVETTTEAPSTTTANTTPLETELPAPATTTTETTTETTTTTVVTTMTLPPQTTTVTTTTPPPPTETPATAPPAEPVPAETTTNLYAFDKPSAVSKFEHEVTVLVNKERAKVGLNPLKEIDILVKAADVRAKEISVLFSHTRPNGERCFTAFYEAGVPDLTWKAENIAFGFDTPERVVEAWMNSEGHRTNILG